MTTAEALDIAWILIAAALVMLMQAGFAALESGLVRTKNSINVAAKNFADFLLSTAVYWFIGFAIMFGASQAGLFGTSQFLFESDSAWLIAFFIFQVGFVGAAVTIVSGAVAERMRFSSYLIVALLMSALLYPVFGHWVWSGLARPDSALLAGWRTWVSSILLGPPWCTRWAAGWHLRPCSSSGLESVASDPAAYLSGGTTSRW